VKRCTTETLSGNFVVRSLHLCNNTRSLLSHRMTDKHRITLQLRHKWNNSGWSLLTVMVVLCRATSVQSIPTVLCIGCKTVAERHC